MVAAMKITQAARDKWLGTAERLQQLKQEYMQVCEHQIDEKLRNMNTTERSFGAVVMLCGRR
jgi:hypothetical protein